MNKLAESAKEGKGDQKGKHEQTSHNISFEAEIKLLREEIHSLKVETDRSITSLGLEIDFKASKQDLEDLETRLMLKLEQLMNNLVNIFADKDATKKKILSLEKNVSFILFNELD